MLTKKDADARCLAQVTFELPAGVHAHRVHLVGEFNNWDTRANPMEWDRATGRWHACLTLTAGRRYRFRYLVDGHEWLNDWYADDHVENPFGSYDSVVDLALPHPQPLSRPYGGAAEERGVFLPPLEGEPFLPSREGESLLPPLEGEPLYPGAGAGGG